MAVSARHLSIAGHVQGVGFRHWMAQEARRRGLRGWVRNRRDGSVEALIIGETLDIEIMVEAGRHGPAEAQVSDLRATPAQDDGTAGFEQRATI